MLHMKNNGIIKMENGVRTQLETDLPFVEAFGKLIDLRSKIDGNYYWIGTL